MKSNRLLKWLVLPLVLLVLFVGIKLFSGGDHASKVADSGPRLTPDEMKALGIEGDTPRDTVATLVGQVKQLRTELQTALGDNKQQKEETERLRAREASIEQRIQGALETERRRLQEDRAALEGEKSQTASVLQDLQRRMDSLGSAGSNPSDLPVGLGLDTSDGKSFIDGMRWVEPDDARPAEGSAGRGAAGKSLSFPTSFGPAQTALEQPGETVRHRDRDLDQASRLKPVYTVPSNSTLMGSIAMTALIGRVPVDGTVNDPFPFKVLIGPENLTANGVDLPEVAGAVVSGTASGDWTLSCVRGNIRSLTFIFKDGTVRTVPGSGRNDRDEDDTGNTQGASGVTTDGSLGWISDPYGIPCVSGERRSNAQQYLGTQALITAAGAGAASLIKSDNGNVAMVAGSNGQLGTVGISGNEAMGRILAGGVQEMSQWVNKLYGQAFAAVYVQPGAKVAVHLERSINIDYAPKGRRVDYSAGGSHVLDLD
ncbi:TIGR03752 family integrating conjugative element protein [Paraburkholderia sp. Ac-20342]|uniref:TIGR03752 family integrating conjugative element protein n=1 Tax=Paraburkholderia sp. Ac-20342 TaxID=2703889 RepID=UPI00197DB703|nr:TIGR03752 family integrating conjugative element protein [Paraburkholderia sp. Ac-20342]MBN3848532.1 TIGR03752 family integrating conjugative element protein [Paraburkholderia sp. Ac-20342]